MEEGTAKRGFELLPPEVNRYDRELDRIMSIVTDDEKLNIIPVTKVCLIATVVMSLVNVNNFF